MLFVVACALINKKNQILLTQRQPDKDFAGYWEFPGGKVELGETAEQAIIRELYEELGVEILQKDLIKFSFASYQYHNFYLFMPLYLYYYDYISIDNKENQDYRWVSVADLGNYKMPPADNDLIDAIKDHFNNMR